MNMIRIKRNIILKNAYINHENILASEVLKINNTVRNPALNRRDNCMYSKLKCLKISNLSVLNAVFSF